MQEVSRAQGRGLYEERKNCVITLKDRRSKDRDNGLEMGQRKALDSERH